jgi:hypothetical protein
MLRFSRKRVGAALLGALAAAAVAIGCGSSSESVFGDGSGQSGGSANAGGTGAGGIIGGTGGSSASAGKGAGADGGFEVCTGTASETEAVGALDMYLIFDRTASMGEDCDFVPGTSPPVNSKACFATYALAQYFMSQQTAGHRLAFEFMSVPDGVCEGGPNNGEATPLIDMTELPVDENHALVQAISNETFAGGLGTQIEAALHGLADYTSTHVTPGRTMIGILMTDGDPNGCEGNVDNLATIVQNHFAATGIKMFFIGMTGATLSNLETYASPGGATPHPDFCGNGPNPCHYWDVGDGDPAAILSALIAIAGQGVVPCVYSIPLTTSTGEAIDFGLVNVQYRDANGNPIKVLQVPSEADCDPTQGGWYYDVDPAQGTPTAINLCKGTCDIAKEAGSDASVNVVFGCVTEVIPQ